MIAEKYHNRGKALKMRLLELDMSQLELAEKVGTTTVYMNHIMAGRKSGEKYLHAICDVLKVDYNSISKITD